MLKVAFWITVIALLSSVLADCVESSELELISPIGAVSRSIIPGWGQVYTHSKLEGAVVFVSIGLLTGGGLEADRIYRRIYNNDYTPAILADSSEAASYFDEANQYYKLSRFLLYTAAGIWAYSIIDAYIDAHVFNARQQTKALDIDDSEVLQIKSRYSLNNPKQRSGEDDSFLLVTDAAESERIPSFRPVMDALFSPTSFISRNIRGD